MAYSMARAIDALKQHHQSIRVRTGWDRRQPVSPVDATAVARGIEQAVTYGELALSNDTTGTHQQRQELAVLLELARGELRQQATATRGR